jgi:hypothetical protein
LQLSYSPLADHANKYGKECNQEAAIASRQCDGCALDLAMGPVRPEA